MNLLARSRVRILNCEFDPLTLGETVDRAMELVHHGQRGCICTVNVAVLMMMRVDSRLQGFVDRAAVVVADGQPLIWVSRWLRTPLPERVAGADLVDALAQRAESEGLGVYLLGARREVVEAAARRLIDRWPRLKLCGIADGYFSPEEARERVREIAHSGANILLVAMGVPRQEYLLEEHWGQLGVNIAVGVGGSFDVVAGFRIRAPRVVQKLGLEWLFRLAQEPRRLWRRYLITNSQFLWLATRAVLSRFARSSAR
jgi:N-acetylglucosaminyldiphosphoundecaprenol N-acetyl-beta-D-mannosaminyltransferase